MPYYSPVLPSVFVDEVPRALVAKTQKQPITRAGGNTFEGPIFLPHVLGTDGRVGRCLGLKTSTFKPCHIICRLGSALDNVDGVKARLLEPTFSLS